MEQPPYLLTSDSEAKSAPERWAAQYGREPKDSRWGIVTTTLLALPVEERTPDRIASIIGNRSWSTINCDQCGNEVSLAVVVGQMPDYDVPSATLCEDCLRAALALFPPAPTTGDTQ